MKKLILLPLLVCFSFTLFAADDDNQTAFFKVDRLLDDNDIHDDFYKILNLTDKLTPKQRKNLYNDYQKSPVGPLVLNLVVPFGVGSFVQKDIPGGIIIAALDGATVLAALYGADFLLSSGYLDSYSSYYYYTGTSKNTELAQTGYILLGVGAVTEIVSIIFKVTRPIRHNVRYNDDLRKVLRLDEGGVAVSFVPDLQLTSTGNLSPSMGVKLSY